MLVAAESEQSMRHDSLFTDGFTCIPDDPPTITEVPDVLFYCFINSIIEIIKPAKDRQSWNTIIIIIIIVYMMAASEDFHPLSVMSTISCPLAAVMKGDIIVCGGG